jgi:hypothetical protein
MKMTKAKPFYEYLPPDGERGPELFSADGAFLDGRIAATQDLPATCNPFHRGSERFCRWLCGYHLERAGQELSSPQHRLARSIH